MPKKKEQIKVKVIKGDYGLHEEFKYNVQIWKSINYGRTFYYTGTGKFCRTKKEVKAYIKSVYQTWYKRWLHIKKVIKEAYVTNEGF